MYLQNRITINVILEVNMNTKLLRSFVSILCLSLCLTALASCDLGGEVKETEPAETSSPSTEEPTTDTNAGGETTTEASFDGIDKDEWDVKFSDDVFENYTVIFEGRMSVSQDGQYDSTSDVWQKLKIMSDKIEITARAEEVGSPADSGEVTMVFDGEIAETYKVQNSQLFLLILRDYDSFVYDPEANTYAIPERVIMEEEIKGIGGNGELIEVPTRIEFREAVVTFSEDGMISTLVCDYSQTMNTGDQVVITSGETTWTFTDFGTTVIE